MTRSLLLLSVSALIAPALPVMAQATCYQADPTMIFCAAPDAFVPYLDESGAIIAGEYASADGTTDVLMYSSVMPEGHGFDTDDLLTVIPLTLTQNSGLPVSASYTYGSQILPHDGYDLTTIVYTIAYAENQQVDYLTSFYLEGDAVIQITSIRNGVPGTEPSSEHGTVHVAMLQGVDIIPFNE